MIDPVDTVAAELLARIAWASGYRVDHGKEFWSGYFRRRIERFATMPLAACVSRLIDSCQCGAPMLGDALAMLDRFSPDETKDIEEALRHRAGLLVALAFDRQQRSRTP